MNRLQQLSADQGQSPWLDNLQRSYLRSGKLDEYRDRGVRGLTSNPSIFQKAIQGSDDYDEQFRELIAAGNDVVDSFWQMVITDIHGACDAFSRVWDHSNGADGYVSVEVNPQLAHDEEGTVAAARLLGDTIDRRNLMVKVPATAAGVPAIAALIGEGRSINVTLIFSLDRYQEVMEAYIGGLERLAADPEADLSNVSSVASFFISRVDTETDRRLETIGTPEALALRGQAAYTQGRLAYRLFQQTFSGERWERLAARGARVQRPLWASTSVKNPDYSDTSYVDTLIGPDSVNTLPEPTLEAFDDHGTLARTVDAFYDEADRVWAALADVGVDMDDVAATLEDEGVSAFIKSFDELVTALTDKSQQLRA